MIVRHRILAVGASLALGVGLSIAAGAPAGAAESTGVGTAAVSAQDAEPGVAPVGAGKTAIYLDGAGQVINPATAPASASASAESRQALLGCTPGSGRDNPHRSGGDVSGHGWWTKGSCSNNRAKVYNCLYEWYTDNTWRQKACSPTKTLKPGGGSSNRTVARASCANSLVTSWRNHVDVDVIGEWDSGEWPHNQANVGCRVY
jgi:hypothetical protein